MKPTEAYKSIFKHKKQTVKTLKREKTVSEKMHKLQMDMLITGLESYFDSIIDTNNNL